MHSMSGLSDCEGVEYDERVPVTESWRRTPGGYFTVLCDTEPCSWRWKIT